MNRNLISAVVIALAGIGNAVADDITIDTTTFVSTKTRAEVQAELAQFTQAKVNPWSISYNQLAGFKSETSRQAVVAEYIANRADVAAQNAEDSGSSQVARHEARPDLGSKVARFGFGK